MVVSVAATGAGTDAEPVTSTFFASRYVRDPLPRSVAVLILVVAGSSSVSPRRWPRGGPWLGHLAAASIISSTTTTTRHATHHCTLSLYHHHHHHHHTGRTTYADNH